MLRHAWLALLLATLVLVAPAYAWGTKGHSWAVENAVQLLPEEGLRAWCTANLTPLEYANFAPDFEIRDGIGAPLEGPNHYFDVEVAVPDGEWEDVPRTRVEALRHWSELGLGASKAGMLPYRLEEMYASLVNAFQYDQKNIALYAGLVAHYASDATQPLHATVNFDGLPDPAAPNGKRLVGTHAEYEIAFVEDYDLGFRTRSLEAAAKPRVLTDVFGEALEVLRASNAAVPALYACADKHQGEGRYAAWNEEIGEMTAERLGTAASFSASLWYSAWVEAGRPTL
jgi:hypothetical protein